MSTPKQEALKILKLKCAKCGKEWVPRIQDPKWCPGCRTTYWKESDRNEDGKIIHQEEE